MALIKRTKTTKINFASQDGGWGYMQFEPIFNRAYLKRINFTYQINFVDAMTDLVKEKPIMAFLTVPSSLSDPCVVSFPSTLSSVDFHNRILLDVKKEFNNNSLDLFFSSGDVIKVEFYIPYMNLTDDAEINMTIHVELEEF